MITGFSLFPLMNSTRESAGVKIVYTDMYLFISSGEGMSMSAGVKIDYIIFISSDEGVPTSQQK